MFYRVTTMWEKRHTKMKSNPLIQIPHSFKWATTQCPLLDIDETC